MTAAILPGNSHSLLAAKAPLLFLTVSYSTGLGDLDWRQLIMDESLGPLMAENFYRPTGFLTRSSGKNEFDYFPYISHLFELREPNLMELNLSELTFIQFNLTSFNRIYCSKQLDCHGYHGI
jgi:hypothetical protein